MHIGLLTADLRHGHGWGHYSLSLIRALRRQGVRVTVVAASNSPTDFDFPVQPLLPNVVPAQGGQLARMALLTPRLPTLLAGCDLLHCTAEPYAPLAQWLADGRPYVVTGHGSYAQAGVNRSWGVRQLHQQAFLRAAQVICVSHYTARQAAAYTPGIRTVVVNNGIDPARFADLPPPPEPITRPTVLTAGGVKTRKGTLPLIEAMAKVHDTVPDAQCIIIGKTDAEPDTTRQVWAAIDAHGLHEQVRLLGFVPERDLLGWYGAADVFALPSVSDGWKFEGYGLVHLEASAAGLPVVGTWECGAADAVDDGETGLLVHQAALETQLPAALTRLLTDANLRARLGAAGRAKAQQQTWDKAARETVAVYRDVLNIDS